MIGLPYFPMGMVTLRLLSKLEVPDCGGEPMRRHLILPAVIATASWSVLLLNVFHPDIAPLLAGGLCLWIVFLLPFGIAFERQHPRWRAILALNLFASWTIVGWIVALVWSLSTTSGGASANKIARSELAAP
jgi:hypothetical protein